MIGRSLWRAGRYSFIDHDGIEHAGYLAFLGLLSLFPFLVIFVTIAGWLGQMDVPVEFMSQFSTLLPGRVLETVAPRLEEIASGPPEGLLTVSVIGIIWTASSTVEGSRTILNRAYRVSTPPSYIWRRLMSVAQFFVFTLAIIVAMTLLIFAPIAWDWVNSFLGLDDELRAHLLYFKYGISGVLLFLVVASSYYYIPNIKQRIGLVVPGTIVVIILWVIMAELFRYYINKFEMVNLIYGSLGGIIATLVFFYIIAFIYIFGAEFNYFYERARGKRFEEKESAVG